jgi:hypothetical protein
VRTTSIIVIVLVVVGVAAIGAPALQERRTDSQIDTVASDLATAVERVRTLEQEWHGQPSSMHLGLFTSYGVTLDTVWADGSEPQLCLVSRHVSVPGRSWMAHAVDGVIHEGDCR